MANVAVVTDSTADLPDDLVASLGLRVVPLSVSFGAESLIAGQTLTTDAFYRRLDETERIPTTSQPSPAWFEDVYADCIAAGHDAVISIHCASALSGTVGLARDRAARAAIPIEVIDSRLVGGSLGLMVLAAQRIAASGGTVADIVAETERVRGNVTSLIVVDGLDHLHRGGRVGGAQATVGRALRVKPLLRLTDAGTVEVRERIRTWARALDRLVELADQAAGGRRVDAIVVHAVAPQRAELLSERVRQQVDVRDMTQTSIGPIVGTHVGPGAVGIALVPTEGSTATSTG